MRCCCRPIPTARPRPCANHCPAGAALPSAWSSTTALAALIHSAAAAAQLMFHAADVLVVAQKIVSKAEGRMIRLGDVEPGPRARELAAVCRKDARLVELVLRESTSVVRCTRDVLIVQHRLGFTVANAGIDQSNVMEGDEHALLPEEAAAFAKSVVKVRRASGAACHQSSNSRSDSTVQ